MLPFSKRSLVMFDLDGTVIDSKQGIFNSLYYTMDRIGMEVPGETVLQEFIGPSIGATFMRLFDFSQEQAEEAVRIYREYYADRGLMECALYAGLPELLAALRAQGKRVALATKKPEMFAKEILQRLGISGLFDAISGADAHDSSEYKGYILEKVIAEMRVVDKTRAVMVGDTWYDCVGAKMAGVDCIGVLYGYGDRQSLSDRGAALIVNDMAALADALLGT